MSGLQLRYVRGLCLASGLWVLGVGGLMMPGVALAQASAVRPAESMRQGDRHFGRGNYEAAIAAYTEALRMNPSSAYAYYNRASAYRRMGQHESAVQDYSRSLQLNPQQPFAYLYRGESLQAMGQHRAAIGDYSALLQLKENDPLAYERRGDAFAALGNKEAAIADYQKAAEFFRAQRKGKDETKVMERLKSLQP
ncbi:tetratricopeptide repeat protein [Synechococcales cyanobacterium C]|uniref:Tetratricopeptide repeat protein n=1 Tax=Petrachloros mirabilis ULC683 TaxID=2781853 RepID=A0A8K1ZZ45_9CYAN|nr:tetratricopeptide repeat protein [Petrachloros mirabilis]NCJ06748.1 tetratricopeptide repeat protein [Petrachloros mirabilis ULC683]